MQQTPNGYNPYAPPVAAGMANAQAAAGAPLDWEIGEVLSQAWGIFKQHALVLILAPFVSQVISQAIGFVIQFAVAAVGDSLILASILGLVALIVQLGVGVFFAAGLTRIFVGAARGETPEFGVLFSGGDRVLPLFLNLMLLYLLCTVGMILLIVPGVIVGLGLMLSMYYCVDRNQGPIEALRSSWDATQGQKGKLFLFVLAAIGISLLGALACLIGIFVAYPVVLLAGAIIYTRLSGTASGPALAPGGAPTPPAWGGGAPAGAAPAGASPAMGQPMSPGAAPAPGAYPGAPAAAAPGAYPGAAPGAYPGAPPGAYPGAAGGGYPGAPGGAYPGAPAGSPPAGAPQHAAPQPGYPGAPAQGGYQAAPPGGFEGGPAAPPGVGGPTPGAPGAGQPGAPSPQQRVGPGGTQII